MCVSFVIYADFESFIVKSSGCENSLLISHENILLHHILCGYVYVITGPEGKTFRKGTVVYRRDCVVSHFLNWLLSEKEIRDIRKYNKMMIFTSKDKENFNKAMTCYICGGIYII